MLASRLMPQEPRGHRSVDLPRLLVVILLILCTTKVCLLLMMAVTSRYVADEYQQAGYARQIETGFYQALDPVKTVLYAYFYRFAHQVSDSAVELMLVARLQGFVLALGMALLVFGATRRLGGGRTEGLFAVWVLLSFSTFMERAYRVRSDTLATFLALAGLWVAVGDRRGSDSTADRPPSLRRPLLVGLLVGAAFLSTQKTAYHALAFGLGYVGVGLRDALSGGVAASKLRDLLRSLLPAVSFCGGWAVSVLAYAVYFGGLDALHVLSVVFLDPLEFALHADEAYGNWWMFLYQTFNRNQLAYGMCFAGLALALVRWRRLPSQRLLALTVALVLTLLVLNHNQPWPYVFVLLLPFLAPWSVEVVDWLAPRETSHGSSQSGRRAAVLLLFTAILVLAFPRNFFFLNSNNRLQNQIVAKAEALLGPEDHYADGLGMIPTRPRAGEQWWWDAATLIAIRNSAAKQDFTVMNDTFLDQPKLWIINYRVEAVEFLLRSSFPLSYVAVDPNIYLAGSRVPPGETVELVAPWTGVYELYGADGEPRDGELLVNGRRVSSPVALEAGPYHLELADPETEDRFLLPAGSRLDGPLPAQSSPRSLFEGSYR